MSHSNPFLDFIRRRKPASSERPATDQTAAAPYPPQTPPCPLPEVGQRLQAENQRAVEQASVAADASARRHRRLRRHQF